ncbi:hypothetical protein [Chitinimonas sp. BJYL2]|nr:hypothetical protein [Chitinimonas sp. BJYL2]
MSDQESSLPSQDAQQRLMRRRNLRTAIVLFVVVAGFIVSVFFKYGAFN